MAGVPTSKKSASNMHGVRMTQSVTCVPGRSDGYFAPGNQSLGFHYGRDTTRSGSKVSAAKSTAVRIQRLGRYPPQCILVMGKGPILAVGRPGFQRAIRAC